MIKNLSFDSRFPVGMSILPFDDTGKIQFETYCRANYYQVIWIKKGNPDFEIDMKTIHMVPDSYIGIGKDMVYKYDNAKDYSGYIISFTDFYYTRTEQDILFLQDANIFNNYYEPILFDPNTFGSDLVNIEYMLKLFNDKFDPLRDDLVHTLLKLFLFRSESTLRDKHPLALLDSNHVYVRDFKKLLNDHFIEHKELSFYTTQLGISSKQLLYATKQVMGKNAKEVIIEKVVVEAKRFLSYSGFSIKQIAYCLGFDEPNNFSIFFNKYAGMTPKAFKKDVANIGK